MKLIALDVGTKRIGVAKADSNVRIAVPYSAVDVDGGELKKIASLARAWDINCFVLGLPRNADGLETEQSRYVRAFAKELKQTIPDARICFQDESLTSVEAEKRLKNRKKGYKKGDIDSEAATIILQDFLEERTNGKAKVKNKATAAKHRSVKANKPHRLLTTFIVILILLGLAGGGLYYYYLQSIQPVFSDLDCDDADNAGEGACKSILFSVKSGATINTVASELKSAGLIRNALAFQVYYRLNYGDQMLKIGDYELNQAMSLDDILGELLSGKGGNVFSLEFHPGDTISDLRALLAEAGYEQAAIDQGLSAAYEGPYSWIFDGKPAETSLEGYLYGETYEFYIGESVENIIGTMLGEMASTLKKLDFQNKVAEHGLNLYQGITLASVVQKEANSAKDQAMVAQIFYNRLANNISLGSDVTVQYARDLIDPKHEIYTDNAAILQIDSPYNTRLYPGLPYGPISNPGKDALSAVATPDAEAANYLFFLTGDDGQMYYSDTYAGHNSNILDHCSLCDREL